MTPGRSRQLPLDWPHRASTAREDLVVGESNRLAVAALDAWPAWPHPVLYVCGPAGSGKSHLGEAWRAASGAARFSPGDPLPEARPFAVLIDDVDRAGFAEDALFALLNAARLGGGSVLLTARRAVSALDVATPDLRSRLRAATGVTLGPPDEALLAGVLAKLFADRQIALDMKLLSLMTARMERSLEAARVLAEAIDRETLAAGRRPTRQLVLDLLARMDDNGGALS